MEVRVNILEVASELAHQDLIEKHGEENLFEDNQACITSYKEHIQEEFNELYDKYFDTIFRYAEDEN